jgi:hypothetical protein
MQIQEIDRFIGSLKHYRLTIQQIKTLRGQALAGDLYGARKGLQQILKKRGHTYGHSNFTHQQVKSSTVQSQEEAEAW